MTDKIRMMNFEFAFEIETESEEFILAVQITVWHSVQRQKDSKVE